MKNTHATKFILSFIAVAVLALSYLLFIPIYLKHKAKTTKFNGTVTNITQNWLPIPQP